MSPPSTRDRTALDALGDSFVGKKVCGVGFDRAVLEEAGITRASALVSCMGSDERTSWLRTFARSMFRVPRVIARLHDLSKAETYRRLDIQTHLAQRLGHLAHLRAAHLPAA